VKGEKQMAINSYPASITHSENLFKIINYNIKTGDKIDSNREKILLILKKIINNELTLRQKECLFLHYYEQKDLTKIANILNIHVSTVCRHIKKAKNRINKTMSYNFPRLT
jgi:RNA polymerase sigma factor (sigma-70 family)